ncbi:MAG: phosphotransferase family protein, partial [Pseudomonadota bacterium]
GGTFDGAQDVVLRTDAQARVPISLDRSAEFRVLETAFAAGVAVAEPLLECRDATIIGAPFTLQRYCSGEASARSLTRAPDLEAWGDDAVFALGRALATVHTIRPGAPSAERLSFLPVPLHAPGVVEVERLRGALKGSTEARPALAYVLRWLETHPPRASATTLVHGDYRTGNVMLDGANVRAILDWEFAHWGDPAEDIGWFTARCWRFGNDAREAGGLGARSAFYEGYRSVVPLPLEGESVPYWEVMAAAKWAAVSVLQGDRYRRGGEDSLELVLTGLMAPEMEFDALTQIDMLKKALPR